MILGKDGVALKSWDRCLISGPGHLEASFRNWSWSAIESYYLSAYWYILPYSNNSAIQAATVLNLWIPVIRGCIFNNKNTVTWKKIGKDLMFLEVEMNYSSEKSTSKISLFHATRFLNLGNHYPSKIHWSSKFHETCFYYFRDICEATFKNNVHRIIYKHWLFLKKGMVVCYHLFFFLFVSSLSG